MLSFLPRLGLARIVEQLLDPVFDGTSLLLRDDEARKQEQDVLARGFDRRRRHVESAGLERGLHFIRRGSPDVMLAEDPLDRRETKLRATLRRRRLFQQLPEPRFADR